MNNEEKFESENLADFLKQLIADGKEHQFTISAKAARFGDDIVILHAFATYEASNAGGVPQQKSFGTAWTTTGDGKTEQKVDRLSIQIEVAGERSPREPFSQPNISFINTATRGHYDSVPQRVTVYAVCENPHLEVTDTSDD